MTERDDFADMLNELSKATHRACSANPLSKLLFDDGDSALPYMKISGDHLDGCMTIRKTNVTPFSESEMDDCSVIVIHEYSPSDRSGLRVSNNLHTRPWIEMERWVSSDGQFGFALFRHSCVANKE
jgi:hypothetical protein